jgi:hypothetical protein
MSDKRWKSVERQVARQFSEILSGIGNSPVERIPLLGREGPDLTVGDTGLVINVKSRKKIPPRLMAPKGTLLWIGGDYVAFRMNEWVRVVQQCQFTTRGEQPWKQLTDWWEFMDKWTKEFKPDGITSIFLHRPNMPIGLCTIVIKTSDLRRLP